MSSSLDGSALVLRHTPIGALPAHSPEAPSTVTSVMLCKAISDGSPLGLSWRTTCSCATLYANCSSLIGEYLPQVPNWTWYALLSVINLTLGMLPIRRQIRIYALVLVCELIALFTFVVAALHALPHASAPPSTPVPVGPNRLLSLVSVGVIGFLGFDGISTLDGEADRPTRSVGQATTWVAAGMGLVFLLQCALAVPSIPTTPHWTRRQAFSIWLVLSAARSAAGCSSRCLYWDPVL
nr:hypothetical protein [Alicyclobacillus sacchari]